MALRVQLAACAFALLGCPDAPEAERDYQVGYRDGTREHGYLSNGERGNVMITEVNWAGSVRGGELGKTFYDRGDIFLELQSKMPRPIHLTGWYLVIRTDSGRGPLSDAEQSGQDYVATYRLPPRESRQAVYPNDYVIIARKRDGAFREADYYLDDFELPTTNLLVTLLDPDLRIIDTMGSTTERIFAGGFDLVSVRSLERVQLIFANVGNRDSAFHAYSLNEGEALHDTLRAHIAPPYRFFTYASPGMPNSPDYSGNISSGTLE